MKTTCSCFNSRMLILVKGSVLILLGYWFVYALVVPVTIWDAHTYNLARLLIIRFGGLFSNTVWNTERQIAWPWTFDAVHYPFLLVGWGYALPSFACFAGSMIIVFHMVKKTYGERCAWYCCLAMLALPTLVFQATSTKNDLAVVFGISCWVYTLWRFRSEGSRIFLFLAALALCFAAGAKSAGIPLAILLSGATIWRLRHDWQSMKQFLSWLLLCLILFGSTEIYLNNWLTYGHPLGPAEIRGHLNPDGVSGMMANFIRYTIGSVNLGVDVADQQSPIPAKLADLCRAILNVTGLKNKGYRWDFNDSNLQFLKIGWEGASDFGPLGTLSLLTAGFVLLSRSAKYILWRMAAAGFASLLLVCATVSWMPWNMRFLLLPFLLFSLTTVILFTSETKGLLGRMVILALSLFSAVAFPLYSFNKGPKDLWLSLADRPAMTTKEHPAMLEIVRDLETRKAEIGTAPILLCAGGDSWVLPVLQLRDLRVVPSPQIDLSRIRQLASQKRSGFVYILALNRTLEIQRNLIPIKKYGEPDSGLFLWSNGEPVAVSATQKNLLVFTLFSGWHQVEHSGADWLCWTDGRGRISIVSTNDTLAVLSGQIFSAKRPNDVDILLNGTKVASLRVDWTKWEFHDFHPVHLPLKDGENTVEFVSHNPAVTLPPDTRPLAIAVKNLNLMTTGN